MQTIQTLLYGIPNCQTVKKARVWLEEQNIPFEFINFKTQAPTTAIIQAWLKDVPLEKLLNRQGTTWRKLEPSVQEQASSTEGAIALMIANPSLIKRPVLVYKNKTHLSFTPDAYQSIFGK